MIKKSNHFIIIIFIPILLYMLFNEYKSFYIISSIFLLILYTLIIYIIEIKNKLKLTIEKSEKIKKKLTEADNKFKVITDSIGDIFILTDKYGNIDYINPIAQEILNYSLKELKGKQFKDIFKYYIAKNDIKQSFQMEDALKNGITISHEEPIIIENKNKYKINVLDRITPIYDSKQNITGTVIVFNDITSMYKVLEELKQSQKLESIGQLSGGIAHDFNNMLAGIMGATEILLLENNLSTYCKENLEIILKSSKKASQLTRQLLDFSRKGISFKEILNVNNEIIEILALLKRSIDKKIKIITNFNAKDKFIKIDSFQFQNVIINLIINAKDAIRKNSIIKIKTDDFYVTKDFIKNSLFSLKVGSYIKISIIDNGIGIPENIREKIFEPFFTTKEIGKGTGLGLSAVYGTVVDYKGFIELDSNLGIGTKISIYFPVIKDYIEENKKIPLKNDVKNFTGSVLVVDDEDIVRIISVKILKKLGFSVYEASNGKEAVKVFKEKKDKIKLVLMDIVMPQMGGREAFYKLKEIDKNVKVILLSGFKKETSLELLIKDGLKGFLLKPYSINDIKNKINDILS